MKQFLTASEIFRRTGKSYPKALRKRLRKLGVPHYATPSGRMVYWRVDALPPDLKRDLGLPVDPLLIPVPASEMPGLTAGEVASASGLSLCATVNRLRRAAIESREGRRADSLGRERPVKLYDPRDLPRVGLSAVSRPAPAAESEAGPSVLEACPPCGERFDPETLLDCHACGKAVCARCFSRDRCRQCRARLHARRHRDRGRLARAAAALDANRAARGDCPVAEMIER